MYAYNGMSCGCFAFASLSHCSTPDVCIQRSFIKFIQLVLVIHCFSMYVTQSHINTSMWGQYTTRFLRITHICLLFSVHYSLQCKQAIENDNLYVIYEINSMGAVRLRTPQYTALYESTIDAECQTRHSPLPAHIGLRSVHNENAMFVFTNVEAACLVSFYESYGVVYDL